MGKRRYITLFLFFVSLLLLAVPVLPHHHHQENFCLQKDVSRDLASSSHQKSADSCTDCCISKFKSSVPDHLNVDVQPHYLWSVLLFSRILHFDFTYLQEKLYMDSPCYLERLHSVYIARVTGLRAPPCFVV